MWHSSIRQICRCPWYFGLVSTKVGRFFSETYYMLHCCLNKYLLVYVISYIISEHGKFVIHSIRTVKDKKFLNIYHMFYNPSVKISPGVHIPTNWRLYKYMTDWMPNRSSSSEMPSMEQYRKFLCSELSTTIGDATCWRH